MEAFVFSCILFEISGEMLYEIGLELIPILNLIPIVLGGDHLLGDALSDDVEGNFIGQLVVEQKRFKQFDFEVLEDFCRAGLEVGDVDDIEHEF